MVKIKEAAFDEYAITVKSMRSIPVERERRCDFRKFGKNIFFRILADEKMNKDF